MEDYRHGSGAKSLKSSPQNPMKMPSVTTHFQFQHLRHETGGSQRPLACQVTTADFRLKPCPKRSWTEFQKIILEVPSSFYMNAHTHIHTCTYTCKHIYAHMYTHRFYSQKSHVKEVISSLDFLCTSIQEFYITILLLPKAWAMHLYNTCLNCDCRSQPYQERSTP